MTWVCCSHHRRAVRNAEQGKALRSEFASDRVLPSLGQGTVVTSQQSLGPFLLSTASWPTVPNSPMPSLFSRNRTTSTSLKPQPDISDEFGRVTSRGSARGTATVSPRKDKTTEKTRVRTLSTAKTRPPGPILHEDEPVIPDGSFFPLNLDPPAPDTATLSDSERGACYISSSFFHRRPRALILLSCTQSRVNHAC